MVGSAAKPSRHGHKYPPTTSGGAADLNHQQSLQKSLSRRVSFNESTISSKSRANPYATDIEGQGEKGRCSSRFNMCCAIGSLVVGVILIFILLFGGIYFSFLHSNLPNFHVQKINIVQVNVTEADSDTFLTAEFDIRLNATNESEEIELVYSHMQAEVTSEDIDFGKMEVKDFTQKPNTSTEVRVVASVKDIEVEDADGEDLEDKSNVHQLLMDIVIRGHLDFLLHGKKMNGFPFSVFCKGIYEGDVDNSRFPPPCNVKMSPLS